MARLPLVDSDDENADPLARALYTDFDALPERERNMARFVFGHPARCARARR